MNSSNGTWPILDECGWPLVRSDPRGIATLRYIDLITYPYLLLLGTVGNVFTLVILCGRDGGRRQPKGIYLIAMAIVDLIYMWFSLPTYIHSYDGEIRGEPSPGVDAFYSGVMGVTMFIQEAMAIASTWLIVGFSADRFIAIRWPMLHLKSNAKRSTRIVITIVLLSSLLAVVRLVDYYRLYIVYIQFDPRPLYKPPRPYWLLPWYIAYLWTTVIVQIVTFLGILVLNVWLLGTILYQRRLRRSSLQIQINTTQAKRTDWSMLPMLGACVVLFLITKIPELIDNAIFLLEKGCVVQASPGLKEAIKPLANITQNINVSLNFVLYCGVDGKFRKKLGGIISSTWRAVSSDRSRLRHLISPAQSTGTGSKSVGSVSSRNQIHREV